MEESFIKDLAVAAVSIMHKLVKDGYDVQIEFKNKSAKHAIVNTYFDLSGQRSSYLSYYSAEILLEKKNEFHENLFLLRRKLTFANDVDAGKENAVLLVINTQGFEEAKNIIIGDNRIVVDDMTIFYRKRH